LQQQPVIAFDFDSTAVGVDLLMRPDAGFIVGHALTRDAMRQEPVMMEITERIGVRHRKRFRSTIAHSIGVAPLPEGCNRSGNG
jgi:hypothetical protein